jgi:hypothetical protein
MNYKVHSLLLFFTLYPYNPPREVPAFQLSPGQPFSRHFSAYFVSPFIVHYYPRSGASMTITPMCEETIFGYNIYFYIKEIPRSEIN